MTDHFPGATKKVLSPAAQAVLTALLQAKFGEETDLVDFPRMSRILGPELAAALRAAANELRIDMTATACINYLHRVATELENHQ